MIIRLSILQPYRLLALLLFGLLGMCAAFPVAAGTGQENAAHASIILTPVADTYISSATPSSSYGLDTRLYVSHTIEVAESSSLFRFNLDVLPEGSVINKAELRLYQTGAPTAWLVHVYRILTEWDNATTWDTQPEATLFYNNLPISAGDNQRITLDITALVRAWVHQPGAVPNFGLLIGPAGESNSRTFGSAESDEPPQLFIEYQAPPDPLSLTDVALPPKVDGICDTSGEYSQADAFQYVDVVGQPYPLYMLQTPTDLFVCIQGIIGNQASFFALYLDTDLSTDEGGNTVPNADDFSLQVVVSDSIASTYVGTNVLDQPWVELPEPGGFGPWEAVAARHVETKSESAEFRVPLSTLRWGVIPCNAPFAIGVYHQSVRNVADDAGWPVLDGPRNPSSWVRTVLQNPPCPIQVCIATATPCTPAPNAQVFRAGSTQSFTVDENGYIVERDVILGGDQLWAIEPFTNNVRSKFTVYRTIGAPQTVNPEAFTGDPAAMTLVLQDDYPLIVHDLVVSSQWLLSPEQRAKLTQQLTRTAELLYDFTDGQFILGDITVYQDYEAWTEADLWLYANNNLRPKATAGGVVETELTDNSLEKPITYYPGYVHMGSYWNRYHKPEGEPIIFEGVPIDPATLVDDWSIVFGHELGHYLFFLFDTYFGVGPDETLVDVYNCTGSAMGWVYEPINWGFVYDPAHWAAHCADTHAHQLLGRDEWATLITHYPWLRRPTSFVPGPTRPPVDLTSVTFIEPATPSTPLPNQTFDLLYENNETAGRKASAYLFRNDRVIGQGNPPKGSTQITLTGAQEGDRFCVYDIDAAPPAPDTPRHQYGCETLEAGDNQLDLERDPSWGPIVLVDPVGPASLAISVTQPLAGGTLAVRIYREHEAGFVAATLSQTGDKHTATVNLPDVTPSAYIQVYVDEPATETDPRREAMAMYGVDGGTVPGPSRWDPKAPVYSSDGHSVAWPVQPVQLKTGEWVSMQYMVETFPSPSGSTRISDAYRVISWPPNLAELVVVRIDAGDLPALAQTAASPGSTAQEEPPLVIRYWNGSAWQPVSTRVLEGNEGKVASAIVPANAIYALFSGPVQQYLPTVRK